MRGGQHFSATEKYADRNINALYTRQDNQSQTNVLMNKTL
jgi:hypothetical protein